MGYDKFFTQYLLLLVFSGVFIYVLQPLISNKHTALRHTQRTHPPLLPFHFSAHLSWAGELQFIIMVWNMFFALSIQILHNERFWVGTTRWVLETQCMRSNVCLSDGTFVRKHFTHSRLLSEMSFRRMRENYLVTSFMYSFHLRELCFIYSQLFCFCSVGFFLFRSWHERCVSINHRSESGIAVGDYD